MPTAEFPLASVWNGSFTTSPSVKREAERRGRPLSLGLGRPAMLASGAPDAPGLGPSRTSRGHTPCPSDVIPMAVDGPIPRQGRRDQPHSSRVLFGGTPAAFSPGSGRAQCCRWYWCPRSPLRAVTSRADPGLYISREAAIECLRTALRRA